MVAVAIGGAALVGGAATVAASSSATKASKKANAANNALQTDIYNQNKVALSPYVAAGNTATPAIQALLGLGGGAGTPGQTDWAKYVSGNPDVAAEWQRVNAQSPGQFASAAEFGQQHYNNFGSVEGRDISPYTTGATSASGVLQAQDAAFKNFRDSTGYQDQFNEGQRAVTSALGNRGMLDSGAAQKALVKYGNYQANQSFGSYLDRLVQQQGVGLGAASAQAGVGTNYANATSANNNNNANNIGNAALSNAGAINGVLQSGVSAYSYNSGLKSSYGGGGSLDAGQIF